MLKFNLDKPIIFPVPIIVPITRAIQQRALDFAKDDKQIFVNKIAESGAGQWMRQELDAPMCPVNFKTNSPISFPYHTEFNKLKDVYVKASLGQVWEISDNGNGVVMFTVVKSDKIINANSVEIFGIFPWHNLHELIENNSVSWDILKKSVK
jgi:hypothetical protein